MIKDKDRNWVVAKDPKAKGSVVPSEIIHGNITPSFTKYSQKPEGIDILKRQEADARNSTIPDYPKAKEGEIAPGGVTIASAEQTIVLSLPALRRLHFLVRGENSEEQHKINSAGQTVLAALGLCAAALAAEKGFDLRSRCLLWPAAPMEWELLDRPGQPPTRLTLEAEAAISILNEAVAQAAKLGLKWRTEPLVLKPAPQLVDLVRLSQGLAAAQAPEEGRD